MIQTKGGQHAGTAIVDLKNVDNYDQIFFTFDVTIVMGSNTKITISGSTANGDGFISNNEQLPGESFTRVITQTVTKSRSDGATHLSIFIKTTLKLKEGKEKYGNTTIGVRVASSRAHFWDIKHGYNNNYDGADEGGLCLGCDEEEEVKYVPCKTQGISTPPRARPSALFDSSSRGSPASVECKRREVSPGYFQFNCEGADPNKITISSEHILWLCPDESENQQLDIVVPNYRVEELIRAALKKSNGSLTTVNILLKKPETAYDVQAQDGRAIPAGKPSVNLQYEPVKGRPIHAFIFKQYNCSYY